MVEDPYGLARLRVNALVYNVTGLELLKGVRECFPIRRPHALGPAGGPVRHLLQFTLGPGNRDRPFGVDERLERRMERAGLEHVVQRGRLHFLLYCGRFQTRKTADPFVLLDRQGRQRIQPLEGQPGLDREDARIGREVLDQSPRGG